MAIQHNQTWDANGNLVHEEWVEVSVPVPSTATNMAIRVALRRLHDVNTQQLDAVVGQIVDAIPDIGEQEDARIMWLYASNVERSHPLVAAIGSALNLTSEQVDEVFRVAVAV